MESIYNTKKQGDAREESYYSALETLLTAFAETKNIKDVHVTSQPKKTEAGNPDFRVWSGGQKIVGYIEAKTPIQDLNIIEKTEQIERYKNTFPNFILTNFIEFRFFRNGFCVDGVVICNLKNLQNLKGKPFVENEKEFGLLLEKFFSFSFPSITSGKPLAVELAKRTRFLRDEVIAEELREEGKNGTGKILGFYEAFQRYLIKGLTKEQFADLYSQTITYGLFASRMRCEKDFNRKLAVYDIPRSIGILREMFEFISLGDLPVQLEWIVDEISNVLANVNVKKVFSEFFRSRKGEDPVFHFYETFLAEYDPKQREQRGVYYTPEPVVTYIVHSLNTILKKVFDLEDGLANENVTILDPAGGTLTFLAQSIKQAVKEFVLRYGEGGKNDLIRKHVLEDFYAFELMIAPYAVGHLKISFLLDELGYKLQEKERLKFYLTNTLELEEIEQTALPGMASLSEESRRAGEVKKKLPILVILGNPPYSGISANMGEWISELINDYKYVDGKYFAERKHWLHDDYVKFIRFAEWKISQIGNGVVGYITNHNYLDNPTFRGMRQNLMNNFDEIHVLDLYGGGSFDRKPSTNGDIDENVFDITKGVAISFFTKSGKKGKKKRSRVYYQEIWDTRENKYAFLSSNDISTTKWNQIEPNSPFYLFIPVREQEMKKYPLFWKITDIFPINSVGIVTARDSFATDFDKDSLVKKIEMFRDLSISDEEIKEKFGLKNSSSFDLRKSRQVLSQDKNWDKYFDYVLYRPFDIRHIYYTNVILERPLYETMRHMTKSNLALISARTNKSTRMNHFFCTQNMMETKCGERTTQSYLFPLYLFPNKEKKPNLNPKLFKILSKTYAKSLTPELVLYYVYAVFYSNTYRTKFKDLLRIDFPRIPFTSRGDLFLKIAGLGRQLVLLHLLKSKELEENGIKFQGSGDNVVEKVTYSEDTNRLFINGQQYFEGVKEEIWKYQIGGYQVLLKWLKYRKGRVLSFEDIKHFCRVAIALKKTTEIQGEIDKLFPEIEKELVEFGEEKQNNSLDKYDK
jgi:hypothetical protein